MHNGFDPVIFKDSEILILGSFPSVKSREVNFYYGHKQNRFWPTLAYIFDAPLPVQIEDKIKFCKKHKIALWDVIFSSNVQGSSDSSLFKSEYQLSDINSLLRNYPSVKKIICNGKQTYDLFIENFGVNLPVFCCLSTSPANPRFNREEWKKKLLDL